MKILIIEILFYSFSLQYTNLHLEGEKQVQIAS